MTGSCRRPEGADHRTNPHRRGQIRKRRADAEFHPLDDGEQRRLGRAGRSIAAAASWSCVTTAAKVGNRAYFAAIQDQMEAGGYQAMLDELLRRRPDQLQRPRRARHRRAPGTEEAIPRDIRGLVDGRAAPRLCLQIQARPGRSLRRVARDVETTEVLFASYPNLPSHVTNGTRWPARAFGRFMVSMGGKYVQPCNAVVGEHIIDVPSGPWGGIARKAVPIVKKRTTGYSIGTLQQARDAFQDATKLAVEWEEADEP